MFPRFAVPEMPVMDMNSDAMTCRTYDMSTLPRSVLQVTSEDSLKLTWFAEDRTPISTFEVKDQEIWGPCLVYFAPAKSTSKNKWFKIYEEAGTESQWCSQRVVSNKGSLVVPMNLDIPSGQYIFRAEVIGLNMAKVSNEDDASMGAQFFSNCGMLNYTSSGTQETMPAGVAFPGFYKYTDKKSLLVDPMKTKSKSYKPPGPPIVKKLPDAPPA
ncbi:hypothetical protein H4R26_000420 [Coemansia thaxteri]|uniref:AA9 family lytic polysaccharide monooxygenase n=1 Tax=Coemansia thaxteri TaxID=2663907 RepID=A0A9W8BIQ6_9FUNG|nr:hypothetical protein H4R26_000420 [Coemansia thaxteri]KAJ2483825.1 hypothetical protein EV174_002851 [Coemansia sp. RSA 2320]